MRGPRRQVFKQKGINVPLAPDEIEAAERVARSEGRDLAGLLHGWIVEKLTEVLRTRQVSEAKKADPHPAA